MSGHVPDVRPAAALGPTISLSGGPHAAGRKKMDVAEAVRRRRAYRVFDPRPIEEEKLRAMIGALRLAPSCNNNQPWRVIVCAGGSLPGSGKG